MRWLSTLPYEFRQRGFEIVHPFDAHVYNSWAEGQSSLRPLPTLGRRHALGFLIGNTASLWPVFLRHFHSTPSLQKDAHPLDRYVERALSEVMQDSPLPSALRFSHVQGEELVSMIDLAALSGFAQRSPAYLAVHREFGPWFALRAAVVLDLPYTEGLAATEGPLATTRSTERMPCEACQAPCKNALKQALQHTSAADDSPSPHSWRAWVAVRDVCPVGRAYRYSDDQLHYHYLKNRRALELTAATTTSSGATT